MRYKHLVLLFIVANATALAPDLFSYKESIYHCEINVWNFVNGLISVLVNNLRMSVWFIDCVVDIVVYNIIWLTISLCQLTICVIKMLLFNSFMMDLYHYLAFLFIHGNTNFGEAANWLLFFRSRVRFIHTVCGVRRVYTYYRVSFLPSRGVARVGLFATLGLPAMALLMELSLLSGSFLLSFDGIQF